MAQHMQTSAVARVSICKCAQCTKNGGREGGILRNHICPDILFESVLIRGFQLKWREVLLTWPCSRQSSPGSCQATVGKVVYHVCLAECNKQGAYSSTADISKLNDTWMTWNSTFVCSL